MTPKGTYDIVYNSLLDAIEELNRVAGWEGQRKAWIIQKGPITDPTYYVLMPPAGREADEGDLIGHWKHGEVTELVSTFLQVMTATRVLSRFKWEQQ